MRITFFTNSYKPFQQIPSSSYFGLFEGVKFVRKTKTQKIHFDIENAGIEETFKSNLTKKKHSVNLEPAKKQKKKKQAISQQSQ